LIRDFFARTGRRIGQSDWLDVGCGAGELLRIAASSFASATGCDLSPGMLRECASFEVHKQPDPRTLPFADSIFDFVTAVCVYHHVEPEDRVPLTLELRRVLRPGGIACIIEHNPWNPATQIIVRRCPVDRNARLLTAGLVRKLMREADLSVRDSRFFLYLPEVVFLRAGRIEEILSGLPLGGQFAVFAERRL